MGNCCSCCKKQGKDPPKEGKDGEKSSSDKKQLDGMEIPSIADQELQFIDEDPSETKKQPEVTFATSTRSSMCNYAVTDCTPATVKKALDVDERMPKFVSPGAWN